MPKHPVSPKGVLQTPKGKSCPSKKELSKEHPSKEQTKSNIKKNKLCANINMINLSLDELKLVAKNRDI